MGHQGLVPRSHSMLAWLLQLHAACLSALQLTRSAYAAAMPGLSACDHTQYMFSGTVLLWQPWSQTSALPALQVPHQWPHHHGGHVHPVCCAHLSAGVCSQLLFWLIDALHRAGDHDGGCFTSLLIQLHLGCSTNIRVLLDFPSAAAKPTCRPATASQTGGPAARHACLLWHFQLPGAPVCPSVCLCCRFCCMQHMLPNDWKAAARPVPVTWTWATSSVHV